MKSMVLVLATVLMMFSFSMVGLAAEQTTTGAMGTMHHDNMASQAMSYTGVITSVDHNGQIIVVKGKDGDKTFDVSKASMKGIPETHHAVTVKYTESNGKMAASSVTTVPQKASNELKKLYDKM